MTRLLTAAVATAAVLAFAPGPAAWAGSWLPIVSTGAGGGVVAPVIAMNARGDTIAAWSGGGNLRSAFRPAGAAAFEPSQVIAGGTATNPEIALDPQGNAVVIWTDNTNLNSAVRPAGGAWQGTQLLSTAAQAATSAREVKIDSGGNATAVYLDGANVLARERPAGGNFAGATFGAAATLDSNVANASNVALAVHPNGGAAAAWQHASTATFVAAAVRPAGGAFGAAQALTPDPAGPNATAPAVAIDAAGNALAVYNQLIGAVANVAWARRPAGGAWSPGPAGAPQYLEPTGTTVAPGPQLAMDSAGNAVAAWQVTSGTPARVRASVVPAGGTPAAPATVSDTATAGSSPVVAANGGSPMVAYLQAVGANMRVDSRLWTGSDWTAPQTASLSDAAIGSLGAAMDDEGNAAAIWEPTIPEDAVSAIYDAAAPTFTLGAPSPATAPVGGLFTFSATGAADRFSAVQPPAWDFGDGTSGEGATVQHSYAASGAFAPTVTVRDAAGNSRAASAAVTVTAAQPPPPPPPPLLPPPVLAKLVNAIPISGTVRVRLPRTRRFVPLAVARQIPIGSIVDARKGRVRITGTDGRTVFSADFYEGMFRLAQRNRRGAPVDIHLFGGSFRGCPRAPRAQLSARSKTRSVRHLWGNGSGRFRTVGRFSAATLRGTTWLTDDRCNGTRTRVRVGAVNVRDFARRRTVVLRAPKSYFARPLTRR